MTEIYTVGHSNRSQHGLITLLRGLGVAALVDVRAVPRSTRHPQFNMAALREACRQVSIAYHWAGRQLGGMRSPIEHSPNTMLDGTLRGYADYMNSPMFIRAIDQLINLATQAKVAIMCAERSFQNCHRALIADYLSTRGVVVIHAITDQQTERHRLSPQAREVCAGLVYDRGDQREFEV